MDEETRKAAVAAIKMVNALVETVVEMDNSPLGVPRGPVFLAFQKHGLSLDQYLYLEDLAVSTGRVRRDGDVLRAAR
jgi:hypothetical protein